MEFARLQALGCVCALLNASAKPANVMRTRRARFLGGGWRPCCVVHRPGPHLGPSCFESLPTPRVPQPSAQVEEDAWVSAKPLPTVCG